jgi:hypothetical protein
MQIILRSFQGFLLCHFKIERYGVSGPFQLPLTLLLLPQFLTEQAYTFGFGCRDRIFVAEIEEIPEPFLVIGMMGRGNPASFKMCNIPDKNRPRKKHAISFDFGF